MAVRGPPQRSDGDEVFGKTRMSWVMKNFSFIVYLKEIADYFEMFTKRKYLTTWVVDVALPEPP